MAHPGGRMTDEDEAFEELAKRQGDWGLQGSRKHQIMRYLENDAMRETQRLGQEIEQEPVACKTLCELCVKRGYAFCANAVKTTPIPFPPQRKPLTEQEMFKIWLTVPAETEDRFAFARAIEAAHGIKGGA